MILCVDPGPRRSGWVLLDRDGGGASLLGDAERVVAVGEKPNEDNESVIAYLRRLSIVVPMQIEHMVMETIEPWGGFTGPDALETKYWVGRFEEAIWPVPTTLLKRSQVLKLLGIGKVPRNQAPAAVRAMLVDRWDGGNPVKRDHPLHLISGPHLWSALAVGVAWMESGGRNAR